MSNGSSIWRLPTVTTAMALALMAVPAFAADAPVPNKGDTAWMLISTAIVLMMSIPGLALFYGGLVRSKNMLSVLTQVFMIVALVGVVWVVLRLFDRVLHERRMGSLHRRLLQGVPDGRRRRRLTCATFSNGVVIPEFAYMVFQMTFAMITPALIVGAFAERMKFSAAGGLHRSLGDVRLFPDRALGLVLGGPGRHRRRRQGTCRRHRRRRQEGRAG